MISAVIRVEEGFEALAVTLRALVPAVAEGLLGDAVVLARAPDSALERVAEAAGATLIVGKDTDWRAGAAAARREWVLCLADGDVPAEGWILALERFLVTSAPGSTRGRLRRPARSLVGVIGALLNWSPIQPGDCVRRAALLDGSVGRPVRIGARIGRDPMLP